MTKRVQLSFIVAVILSLQAGAAEDQKREQKRNDGRDTATEANTKETPRKKATRTGKSFPVMTPELAKSPLPKVLIIGDSISIGYISHVERALEGKAIVVHNEGNAKGSGWGRSQIDEWLGDYKWDVIHFNWGLWDLVFKKTTREQKLAGETGGGYLTPIDRYESNLEYLVTRLKQTEASLIWASTTVVPEGEPARRVGDDIRYNAVAARVMAKHEIPINDLHALTTGFDQSHFRKPGDVHYKATGSAKLAEQVTKHISAALMAR